MYPECVSTIDEPVNVSIIDPTHAAEADPDAVVQYIMNPDTLSTPTVVLMVVVLAPEDPEEYPVVIPLT